MKTIDIDLQLGDLVMYGSQAGRVSGIESPMPRKDPRFSGKTLVTLWVNGIIIADLEEIEPIPITEEILKANGITDEQYTFYDGYNFEFHNGVKDCISVGALWYVHELQHALRICGLNVMADNLKL